MQDAVKALEGLLASAVLASRCSVTLPTDVVVPRSTSSILRLLDEGGPQRIGAIAQSLGLDPSTATRQVQQAVAMGLVARSVDPEEARAKVLTLTGEGLATHRSVLSSQREMLADATADWSDRDRGEFLRLLGVLNADVARARHGAAGLRPL